ncbi:MAG: hypothetical protein KGL39_18755 [Patescibacteria group bacterium]|nr:hypothetical protein [Patescibacteria group bacterium]
MMLNAFNPWLAFTLGQEGANSMAHAEEAGRTEAEREAFKRVAGRLGSQNYFAGYEGIPGAERPAAIKELWGTNPEQAAQLEALYAEPFKVERDIRKMGQIEAAKKAADLEYNKNLMREFLGSEPGQAAMAQMPGAAPQAESAPAPGGDVMPSRTTTPFSATERSLEIGPTGPKIGLKTLSPFEQSMKQGEDTARRESTKLAKAKESREALQQAHDNVRTIRAQMQTVTKDMQNRDMPWEEGRARLGQLQQDLADATAQRDQLLGRRGNEAAAPIVEPVAPASVPQPRAGAPAYTEKEQATLTNKNREERLTAANKEIVGAREHALKIQQYMPQVKEIFDLVTKHDVGHPELEGVPMAQNALSLSRTNSQVNKLQQALTNMFAQPGQSQMMNTIVERMMQAAAVPSLFTDPQLNKANAASLRSNVEHLRNLPTFLEQWSAKHGNTLDGATEAWLNYVQSNPYYLTTKAKNGEVKVTENPHIASFKDWVNGARGINGRVFMPQPNGTWRERQ